MNTYFPYVLALNVNQIVKESIVLSGCGIQQNNDKSHTLVKVFTTVEFIQFSQILSDDNETEESNILKI